MLFVAAAGNGGSDNDDGPGTSLPASFDLPNIVSVAAVDNSRRARVVLELRGEVGRHRGAGPDILSAIPADVIYPDPG